MKAIAVIGSAFGDEGKGAAVDAIAAQLWSCLVVRHNGGAQAGHTVHTPDGKRHIFSHFGSGALAGAPTHLSEHFVVNPRIFNHERVELVAHGANLDVTVDPRALVTTPLDVAINRALERARNTGRHGSVGVGFGETIERSERGFPLTVADLDNEIELKRKVERIVYEWLPSRRLEIPDHAPWDNVDFATFFEECERFRGGVGIGELRTAAGIRWPAVETVIFEGAQGLLLDQRRGLKFPYVTRSNTGLQNVMPMLREIGADYVDAVYMMRPYLTRHGAGPLPGEIETIPGVKVVDPTNIHGPWQGELRLAPFDEHLIWDAILVDMKEAVRQGSINPWLGMSCLDQVPKIEADRMQAVMLVGTNNPLAVAGYGPRRDQYRVSK